MNKTKYYCILQMQKSLDGTHTHSHTHIYIHTQNWRDATKQTALINILQQWELEKDNLQLIYIQKTNYSKYGNKIFRNCVGGKGRRKSFAAAEVGTLSSLQSIVFWFRTAAVRWPWGSTVVQRATLNTVYRKKMDATVNSLAVLLTAILKPKVLHFLLSSCSL